MYTIPLKIKSLGAHSEILSLFSWKLVHTDTVFPVRPFHYKKATAVKNVGHDVKLYNKVVKNQQEFDSVFFYQKVNDLYVHNTNFKKHPLNFSDFSFYFFLDSFYSKTFSFLKGPKLKLKAFGVKKNLCFNFTLNQFFLVSKRLKNQEVKITRQLATAQICRFLFKKSFSKKPKNVIQFQFNSTVEVSEENRTISSLKALRFFKPTASSFKTFNLWF